MDQRLIFRCSNLCTHAKKKDKFFIFTWINLFNVSIKKINATVGVNFRYLWWVFYVCLDFLSRFDTNLFHFLLCYVNDVFSSSPKSPEMSSICMCGEMTKLMDGHFSFGDALCPVRRNMTKFYGYGLRSRSVLVVYF